MKETMRCTIYGIQGVSEGCVSWGRLTCVGNPISLEAATLILTQCWVSHSTLIYAGGVGAITLLGHTDGPLQTFFVFVFS